MSDLDNSVTSISLLARLREEPERHQAWDDFVARYVPKIKSWCMRWGLQEADAHDVTQDVLLQLAKQMHRFEYDPKGKFRSWLKTVTWRAWADFLRKRGNNPAQLGTDEIIDRLNSVEAKDDLMRQMDQEADKLKVLGPNHVGTYGAKYNLVMSIWRQDRHQEAIDLLREILPGYADGFGPANSKVMQLLFQLGNMQLIAEQPQSLIDDFKEWFLPVAEQVEFGSAAGQLHVLMSRAHLALANIQSSRASLLAADEAFHSDHQTTESHQSQYRQQLEALEQSETRLK